MKYCSKCGVELVDEAVVCVKCGCATELYLFNAQKKSDYTKAAKVLMIVGTVLNGFFILPLAWCIPMTVVYCNKIKNNRPVGIGFKICSLLFVSLLGGIFMFSDNNN